MPQIQNVKQDQAYGVAPADNTKMFQERLMDRFGPADFVTVKNVDDEAYIWQYLPTDKERQEYTQDGMQKITLRDEPEMWLIEPGQTEVLVGANAYLMIEGLYKKLVAKQTVSKQEVAPGQARKFNYTDANLQEKWINAIYCGKATPQFNVPQTNLEEDVENQIANSAKKVVAAKA